MNRMTNKSETPDEAGTKVAKPVLPRTSGEGRNIQMIDLFAGTGAFSSAFANTSPC